MWVSGAVASLVRVELYVVGGSGRPRRPSRCHVQLHPGSRTGGHRLITEVTGVAAIERLYIQLQYQCNYRCLHCFHGQLLDSDTSLTATEVAAIATHFRDAYSTETVVLLGGEPLLHPEFDEIAERVHRLGLKVEIVTNGHSGFLPKLEAASRFLAFVRVSLDGMEGTHDRIRQPGSWSRALRTIRRLAELEVALGVTCTVTDQNIEEIPELASALADVGVRELKLHHLRLVGNAREHPELVVQDPDLLRRLAMWARSPRNDGISIVWDHDLDPDRGDAAIGGISGHQIDRIELAPDGALTMSCKAVGTDAAAFFWNSGRSCIDYRPSVSDELVLAIDDVSYQR